MAKAQTEMVQQAPKTKDLHGRLKEIVQREIDRLPELLEQLEPRERVKTLLQLLPYATPKIANVEADFGEGFAAGWD
jgi:hypothetical protein